MIDAGFDDFADRWNPILDVFDEVGVRFALEVHPTEIAFDVSSAQRALDAVKRRPAFGFNYDPSHFGYQGVDYVAFIERFGDRIYHAHMKDVWWSDVPKPSGVFGGHLDFGHRDRYWEFRIDRPREDRLRGDHPRPEQRRLSGAAVDRVGGHRDGPRVRRAGGVREDQGDRLPAVAGGVRLQRSRGSSMHVMHTISK